MSEFWNSQITEASWEGLKRLREEIDFVLIGGWAIYLYSGLQKSKDIDIIVEYEVLSYLSSKYALSKNDRLKKYEIKLAKYDVDIYLPDFSTLTIPPKDIVRDYSIKRDGFTLPIPEALISLKLGAAKDRRYSTKGDKDSIDILGLLLYSNIDLKKMKMILSRYDLSGYTDLLISILMNFDKKNLAYLNLNEHQFSKLRKRYGEQLRLIR